MAKVSEPNLSPIQSFYKDKSIFITGGTGFMGKVLIEKLLYSCSDLKEIFILMRTKRGISPETRLENIFKLPMFQRIRDEKPEVLKKLIPLQGDVTFDKLGLSNEATERVIKDTSIVFHCAATLRLEACLKDAIRMNTTGTKRMLELSKKMPKLIAMIHLSTAFCYCDKDVLYEKVFDCPHDPEEIIRVTDWMDDKSLELITPNLLKPHPNTYTYSKRLAEMLVRDEYPNLPVVITRPSIVCPAYAEPVEGWVDSLNGPVGVMIGGAKGVIRSMLCNGKHTAEVIPVDIAINALIAIAFATATEKEKPRDIPVFNITCSEAKRVTWEYVLEEGKRIGYQYPFEAGVWYPNGSITTSEIVHTFNVIFFHWLPAYFIDFIMLCIGQKRFMCRIQRRISDGLNVLQFFTTRAWDFKSKNLVTMITNLTDADRRTFQLDMTDIDNKEYLFKCVLGGRQYVIKEPLSTIPKARLQLKVLFVLDLVVKILFYGFLIWTLLKITGLKVYFHDFFSSSEVSVQSN